MNNILVTGGAGYIGSHTCIELLNAGYKVIIFDNFSNSHPDNIRHIECITGKTVDIVQGDIRDQIKLERALKEYNCTSVIHLAGLKSIIESIEKPLDYYDNNVIGTHRLLLAMQSTGVKTLVFSSSASVYGEPQHLPVTENHPLSTTHPYGRSKIIIEHILRDLFCADSDLRIGILRYFNPIGAHASGLIGENPQGKTHNLLPFIGQVAIGQRKILNIWGSDYPTPDGTGVRDYIHVVDLALGHIKALEHLTTPQCFTVNLGTGRGYSVLEIVNAFEKISNRVIPYILSPRRNGDVASCYADPSRAAKLLNWRAMHNIETMCADHWNWQKKFYKL